MDSISFFVPKKSEKLLQTWIDNLNIEVKIVNSRKYKLGDFRVQNMNMKITINKNLNQYSFLITIVHEIAHAFVFKKYKNNILPHGKEWKKTFKSLMLNFLTLDFFPEDILKVLTHHMINPKASTYSDLDLVRILREYNKEILLTVSDLHFGDCFKNTNGKIFSKGKKKRKRFECVECKTNKIYLFHPFAEIVKVN
tara:strand:- start:125 stop:712 length:588 start_codon:yes stop_codon:yes gene_type:complete